MYQILWCKNYESARGASGSLIIYASGAKKLFKITWQSLNALSCKTALIIVFETFNSLSDLLSKNIKKMDNITNRYNFMLGNIDYMNLNKLNQFFHDSQNFLSYANFLYVSWIIMQLISIFLSICFRYNIGESVPRSPLFLCFSPPMLYFKTF